MRILNRPMFRYGGRIKEGVMHGMKNGGSMREAQQWNTVGSPVFPKDNSGRAKHVLPAAAIMAGLANLYRGYRAARYIAPHAATMGAKIKSAILPTSRFMSMGPGKMFRTGAAIKQNPMLAFTAASMVPQAGYGAWRGIKGGIKKAPDIAKGYVDMVLPGEQFRDKKTLKQIEREGGPPGGGDPGMFAQPKKPKGPSAAELAAEAKAARTKKLNKYLDTMGYDKAKKGALGDALIDASAIVQDASSEAGSLKKADWGKMINKAIQATSKRLDKPEQIREAVGLMMTKADIAKDATAEEDALNKLYKTMQIQVAQKGLAGNTLAESIQESFARNQKIPSGGTLAGLARTHGIDAKVLPISEIPKDMSAIDYITIKIKESADKGTPLPEGNYVVKDRLIHVDETGTITDLINQ